METLDFIRARVREDVAAGLNDGKVVTRFPPEPNGYLHLGHVKAICLDFEVAREYGGPCRLRFDDTNPGTEREEYARAIAEDIRWLGFRWEGEPRYASDYFEQMYAWAEGLVEAGDAYVDSQSLDEIREQRGTVTEPGTESPWRDRPVAENLDFLRRMRAGEFPDGAHVLRARIDMSHPNMLMRDPVLYRIRHKRHFRRGDAWCIYPMYDFAHCLGDAIEGVTHSFCTLEFDNNREIYDWIIDRVPPPGPRPRQYEFARFELEGTVLSKRRIRPLIESGAVDGWDDPRLDTIRGLRRRGVPAEALKSLMRMVGVTKVNTRVDRGKFNYAVRSALDPVAPRVMAVLRPLRLSVRGLVPASITAPRHPDRAEMGTREVPMGAELFIERTDFDEKPHPDFRRLTPGGVVRLRHGPVVRCDDLVRGEDGKVAKIFASVAEEGARPRATIHWVNVVDSLDAEVRLYGELFTDPEEGVVNPDSLEVVRAKVEPTVAEDQDDTSYQFERQGYFRRDPCAAEGVGVKGIKPLVFNRIVTLADEPRRPLGEVKVRVADEVEHDRVLEWNNEAAALIGRIDGWRRTPNPPASNDPTPAAGSPQALLVRFDTALAALSASLGEGIPSADGEGSGGISTASDPSDAAPNLTEAVARLTAAVHEVGRLAGELPLNVPLRSHPEYAVSRSEKAVRTTAGAINVFWSRMSRGDEKANRTEDTLRSLERASAGLKGLGDRLCKLREELTDMLDDDADLSAEDAELARLALELRKRAERSQAPPRTEHLDLVTRTAEGVFFLVRGAGRPGDALSRIVTWAATELRGVLAGGGYANPPFPPRELNLLSNLVDDGKLTAAAAKQVLSRLAEHGGTVEQAVAELDLDRRESPERVRKAVGRALADHPDKVAEYRAGRKALLGMFMGEVIGSMGRGVDPKAVREELILRLK